MGAADHARGGPGTHVSLDPGRARQSWQAARSRPGRLTAKVLFYTDARTVGGAERVLATLMRGLDGARWQPVLACHPHPGIDRLRAEAVAAGARVIEVPWPSDKIRRVGAAIPEFVSLLARERPTLLHVNMAWPLAGRYIFVAAAIARGLPVVATAHSFMRLAPRAALLQRIAMSSAARVIAVSAYVAQGFRAGLKIPARKIRIVRNGIDSSCFDGSGTQRNRELLPEVNAPVVLTVARLDEGKGIEYLLRAAVRLGDCVFVLAGDGPLRPALEREAASLGVNDRVMFLGERSDIADLLARCQLFVLPSLNEGLPLTVLEAMAAGRPVVATTVGGIPEVVIDGRTGVLVPPADPQALTGAIRALVDHPAHARELAAAGQVRCASEFSLQRMVDGVTAVYEELIAARETR